MSHTLIIFLPAGACPAPTPVRWLLQTADNVVEEKGRDEISTLYQHVLSLCDDFSVVAIAPAECVLSANVTVPSTQLRQIKQALPFMVEELIAEDIENVHTAIPAELKSERSGVDTAIIEHADLIEWLDALHSNQLSPSAIVVDALCLPFEHSGWSVLVDGSRVVVRSGENLGIAMQREDAELILGAMLQDDQKSRVSGNLASAITPQIHLMASQQQHQQQDQQQHQQQDSEGDADMLKTIAQFLARDFSDYEVKSSLYQEHVTELLSHDWRSQARRGINLLQGGYAIRKHSHSENLPWGLAASVAGIGVLLYLLLALGSGWYFDSRAGTIEQQSTALYRQLFPAERRVINPRKQMENHLRQSTYNNNSSFLALLAETANQINSAEVAQSVSVKQIRFNSEQGDLRFEINSRSLDQLDQFKNTLAAGGLKVDINSASDQGDGVVGRIVVSQL